MISWWVLLIVMPLSATFGFMACALLNNKDKGDDKK